jgi:polyisoprenoid-binding protein YceI
MRHTKWMFKLALALALGMAGTAVAEPLKVDPAHSFIVFQIKRFDVSNVYGTIAAPTGTVDINEADPAKSSVQVTAKAENINTGVRGRDDHLKRPDFFDARQFPDLTFKSTSTKKTADNVYEIVGDLSFHGVTKPITVQFKKIGAGNTNAMYGYRAGYEATFTIKRSDWGMTTLADAIGDEVKLTVALECSR